MLAVAKKDLEAYKEALFWSRMAWASLKHELKDDKKMLAVIKSWDDSEEEAWNPGNWDLKTIAKLNPKSPPTAQENPAQSRKRPAPPASSQFGYNKRLAKKAKMLIETRAVLAEMVFEEDHQIKKKKFLYVSFKHLLLMTFLALLLTGSLLLFLSY